LGGGSLEPHRPILCFRKKKEREKKKKKYGKEEVVVCEVDEIGEIKKKSVETMSWLF